MSFENVRSLTTRELIALAFVEFDTARFTANAIASHLCVLLGGSFSVSSLRYVQERLVDEALPAQWISAVKGPKNGQGYIITDLGVAAVSSVELPLDLIAQREEYLARRSEIAVANAGPDLQKLIDRIPADRVSQKSLIESIFEHWFLRGRLSAKQAAVVSGVSMEHGELLPSASFVGVAPEEWRAPYRDAYLQRQKERHVRAEAEARKEAARQAQNKMVKSGLLSRDDAGQLDSTSALWKELMGDPEIAAIRKSLKTPEEETPQ